MEEGRDDAAPVHNSQRGWSKGYPSWELLGLRLANRCQPGTRSLLTSVSEALALHLEYRGQEIRLDGPGNWNLEEDCRGSYRAKHVLRKFESAEGVDSHCWGVQQDGRSRERPQATPVPWALDQCDWSERAPRQMDHRGGVQNPQAMEGIGQQVARN